MGTQNRLTRQDLAGWEAEESGESFMGFLDDVADLGFRSACTSRGLTLGETLRWIGENEGRSEAYSAALKVKGEVLVHESLEIVDGPGGLGLDKDSVPGAKLRTGLRMQIAGHWNERYRPRVNVQVAGEVRIDAGLVGFAGDLLERVIGSGSAVPLGRQAGSGVETPAADAVPETPRRESALLDPPRMMTIVGPGDLVREVPWVPYVEPEREEECRL